MGSLIQHGWENLLAFTYPNTCRICEEWPATQAEGYVCGTCWTRPGAIQFINEPCCQRCGMPFPTESSGPFTCENCRDLSLPFDWARASVRATPFVLNIVHRYKYSGHRWFEPFLIDILSRMVGASVSILEWDVLIPIPLHSVKRRDREFNQAERLATALSKRFGWPVLSEVVVRTSYTESQTHLSRRARVANVKSAFSPGKRAASVRGLRALIVDDVLTTGSTAGAVAEVLSAIGAKRSAVVTVARGL